MTARALLLLLAAMLGGCASVQYYGQAVAGHLEVMGASRPITEVLAVNSDAKLKSSLRRAQAIRTFAVRELSLPDNDSYRDYVDLGRPFVVWNVVATPELDLRPRSWCFLVVGCLAYRGYYDESQARATASELAASGDDVSVGGVRAYSTLGWFDDPVLNTMLAPAPPYLAGVMFHELAHQQLYVSDDSAFNEAFATAVEREGVKRWLDAQGAAADREGYDVRQRRHQQFTALVMRYRTRLAELYASDIPVDIKRARKPVLFAQLREDYARLSGRWGVNAYARYFDEGLNNARLAAVATYLRWVPAFEGLLRQHRGDLRAFYEAAARIGRMPPDARRAALAALCPEGSCDVS